MGSVQEITLARVLHDNSDPTKVLIGDVMAKPLPQVDVSVHLDEAYRLLLAGNTGVLARRGLDPLSLVKPTVSHGCGQLFAAIGGV